MIRAGATVALERLLAALQQLGVFHIRSGTVDSLMKTVGGMGLPGWLTSWTAGTSNSATEARASVASVLDSLPGALS
jgi:hypothetical protein